eukprot:3712676-Lingulodinium_polyedra.AAC.1
MEERTHQAEKLDEKAAGERWKAWLEEDWAAGGRRAFRAVKDTAARRAPVDVEEELAELQLPHELLEGQCEKHRVLWSCGEQREHAECKWEESTPIAAETLDRAS